MDNLKAREEDIREAYINWFTSAENNHPYSLQDSIDYWIAQLRASQILMLEDLKKEVKKVEHHLMFEPATDLRRGYVDGRNATLTTFTAQIDEIINKLKV